MEKRTYDAIIIGAGQSGVPLSKALAQAGYKTAVVEREYVGGSCINWGCTPTKTMVASARIAYLARRAGDYGVRTGAVSVDMPAVRQRKRDIVESFREGTRRRIVDPGADLIMGEASFSGPDTLMVRLNDGGELELSAERIFINTGGRPRLPDLLGLDTIPYLNSTTITELDEVPDHLLIIGGGYIGVEFGQMFRRFGSRVTIVQRGGQLLEREDPDVAAAVLEIFQEDGIDILLNSQPLEVGQGERGGLRLSVSTLQGEKILYGSHLLIAAGRLPNTERLNLPAAGIVTDARGYVVVNDRLETNLPRVYAMGDVKGGPAFTHISYDDYRILKTNLLEGGEATVAGRMVPYTVFIDPQLGRVGLSEEQARQGGRAIRVAKMPMNYIARSLEVAEPRGLMKAIVDAETDQILGVAVLGIEGGELMSLVQVAMLGRLPYTTLRDAIFTHPTLAEGFNNLFASFEE